MPSGFKMERIKLNEKKKFYFLGIGGISMSTLAVFLKSMGNIVSGSDTNRSKSTEILEEEGIEVDFCFEKRKIESADYVIYSSAIKDGNEQFEFAKSLGKRLAVRGELLGEISKQFEKVIAVAGSHGKTTTTAMIYEILKVAGKNPTLHLGGFRCEDDMPFFKGGEEFFVTESCEYCDNFLYLHPFISVVTNVEREHMDYFKTFDRQLESFETFKKQSKFLVEGAGEYSAKYITHKKSGQMSFSLFKGKEKIMRLNLQIFEEINAQNCIYAYQVGKLLGLSDLQIKEGLENFKGVRTRFEKVRCAKFENVICDYSHHPTEISKAILSARKIFKNRKLIVVFQPHTFSRTKNLLDEFLSVLKTADVPLIYKTYSAREKEEEGISAEKLASLLVFENKNTKYIENFEKLEKQLSKFSYEDVVMFVGAGDLPSVLHKNNFIS